jgi:hypothetical protein
VVEEHEDSGPHDMPTLILILVMMAVLCGCGLHGTRAEFIRVDGEYYIFEDWHGQALRLKVNERTRKEPDLQPGDDVQIYYSDDGLAQFIVKP